MGGIMTKFQRVALIGFGEVGQIFARDLRAGGISHLAAFDIAFENPDSLQIRAAQRQDVTVCASAGEAAAQADLVISSVTAGSALAAAESVVGHLRHAPFFLDVNSVSPSTKQAASMVVEQAGGRYVEAAVMTSVPPHGIRSPMLLGGSHAEAFIDHVAQWDMRLTAFSPEVGRASSVKMCRSVMIKGLEALTTECLLAARHYGVEDQVLNSLADTLPHEDWRSLARYMISRALLHGRRRAEEMREVARTVQEAGIEPMLASSTVRRQDWAFARGQELGPNAMASEDLDTLLDALLAVTHQSAGRPSGD
jgi:3-hydroxyisobutyrate dehydrogenase-like beta-hydroxyacid dehydrogenase